jgi:hypothetical protein
MSKPPRSIQAENLTGLLISLQPPIAATDHDEIVRLASLTRKAELTDEDRAALDRASAFDLLLVAMASKLLEGERFSVCSDNPETLERARSSAQHLGASINAEFHDPLVGKSAIIFDPPSHQ